MANDDKSEHQLARIRKIYDSRPGAPQQTAHAVALASLLPFDVYVDHLLPVLDAQVVKGEKLA